MNSTAVSVSQPNNGDRKVNNEELQSNELAIQSSTSPASNSSIQARLATLFPTIGSNRASGKSTSRRPARSKQTIKSTKGRPPKTLVYKDLVLIPSPKINKVPTHTTRLQLEERELVCHEFPFDKSWDAHSLKAAILNRCPKLLLFEYVKVGNFALWYNFKHCSTFNALIISLLFSLYICCGCTIFKEDTCSNASNGLIIFGRICWVILDFLWYYPAPTPFSFLVL